MAPLVIFKQTVELICSLGSDRSRIWSHLTARHDRFNDGHYSALHPVTCTFIPRSCRLLKAADGWFNPPRSHTMWRSRTFFQPSRRGRTARWRPSSLMSRSEEGRRGWQAAVHRGTEMKRNVEARKDTQSKNRCSDTESVCQDGGSRHWRLERRESSENVSLNYYSLNIRTQDREKRERKGWY